MVYSLCYLRSFSFFIVLFNPYTLYDVIHKPTTITIHCGNMASSKITLIWSDAVFEGVCVCVTAAVLLFSCLLTCMHACIHKECIALLLTPSLLYVHSARNSSRVHISYRFSSKAHYGGRVHLQHLFYGP